MAVTIINTLANPPAVAERGGVPLANMNGSDWARPRWTDPELRRQPWLKGANFLEGEIIAERIDAPAGAPPIGQRFTVLAEPVIDVEAMTATWYGVADLSLAEIAASLRPAVVSAFTAARDAGTVAEVAEGVEIVIATTHAAAVELREAVADIAVNGTMPAVTRDGVPVPFTEAGASAALDAIRAHVRACCLAEYNLTLAIAAAVAADDRATLLAIDPTAGFPAPPE